MAGTRHTLPIEGMLGLPTDRIHVVVVPGLRFVNLRLLDFEHQPLPDVPCTLRAEGREVPGRTDPDGKVQYKISVALADAEGLLEADSDLLGYRSPRAFVLEDIPPVDTPAGQRIRLDNLGYVVVETEHDDPETPAPWAIEEFQCEHGLGVDGVCGPLTQAKLQEVHGH